MLTITNSWHLKFDSSCQNLWSLNTVIKFILDKTFDISQLSTSSSRSSTSCLLDILDNNLVYDNNHLRQWRHPHQLFNLGQNRQIRKSRQIAKSPNRRIVKVAKEAKVTEFGCFWITSLPVVRQGRFLPFRNSQTLPIATTHSNIDISCYLKLVTSSFCIFFNTLEDNILGWQQLMTPTALITYMINLNSTCSVLINKVQC